MIVSPSRSTWPVTASTLALSTEISMVPFDWVMWMAPATTRPPTIRPNSISVRIVSFSARVAVAHDGHGAEEVFLWPAEGGRKTAAGQRRFSRSWRAVLHPAGR